MPGVLKPELLSMTPDQIQALVPYFWVLGGSLLAILLSVMRIASPKYPVLIVTLATCVAGIVSSQLQISAEPITLFNGMMVVDGFSKFFNILFLACAGLSTLASFRYLDNEKLQHPEYYVLLLLSAFGMMTMAASLDLIVLFIALELMSLAVYVLVGFRRADRRSNEAAMKYFILGGAASAILLYGVALLYGATGSINIREILALLSSNPAVMTPVFAIGAWLLIAGFLFKVASVPFHMWMPDVYEGAPVPVTGFMTTGLKAAAFASFVRVFISVGYGNGLAAVIQAYLHDILWVIAVLTMLIGNLVALTQTNLKRMLAYSSIAHTGYLIVGILTGHANDQGYAPVVLYLVSYAVMNLGAFAVLSILASREDHGLGLHDLSGLAKRHPLLAFAMAVFLLSMAGIPPTAGFAAKYLLFYSAVQAGEVLLVVLAVLCSAISVYYYLRVLVHMYMREPVGAVPSSRVPVWAALAVAALVAMTLQIGVLPAGMVSAAKKAVMHL